jgi:hypothetical protein
VLLSGIAGAIVDSAAFLLLAFGSLDYMAGQVVGKLWASLAAVPVIALMRRASAETPLPPLPMNGREG